MCWLYACNSIFILIKHRYAWWIGNWKMLPIFKGTIYLIDIIWDQRLESVLYALSTVPSLCCLEIMLKHQHKHCPKCQVESANVCFFHATFISILQTLPIKFTPIDCYFNLTVYWKLGWRLNGRVVPSLSVSTTDSIQSQWC